MVGVLGQLRHDGIQSHFSVTLEFLLRLGLVLQLNDFLDTFDDAIYNLFFAHRTGVLYPELGAEIDYELHRT